MNWQLPLPTLEEAARTMPGIQRRTRARIVLRTLFLVLLLTALSLPAAVFARSTGSEGIGAPNIGLPHAGFSGLPAAGMSVERRYIVVLKNTVRHPGAVADDQTEEANGEVSLVYRSAIKGYAATLPVNEVKALKADPRVAYVSPDRKVEIAAQTIPTGLDRAFATANENLQVDGEDNLRIDADVAVIDTGIDYEHPDLNVAGRTNCVPFNGNPATEACIDNDGKDGHSHGTHVAGTIAALDDGEGVVGVAPGARLWAVKVLNNGGSGYESWIVAGIDWVTAHAEQIEVANMSLGGRGTSAAMNRAIEKSVQAGVLYAVAAGNDASDASGFFPANSPDVVTVSALADYDGQVGGRGSTICGNHGPDDTLATFSNFGEAVEVAAPGVCILSTVPGGRYATFSGTSMATPHVAGAAAILASESNPEDEEDVAAIAEEIQEEGNLDWEDTSRDREQEPLLDVGDETVFDPTDQVLAAGEVEVVSSREVTLHGMVNPGGKATTYYFEYGETTSYGNQMPVSARSAGSGDEYLAVEEAVDGLKGQTLYHYRLVASNSGGTFYGGDRLFGTTPPIVETEPASDVNANDAVFNATVDPEGLETTYQFEFGATTAFGRSMPLDPEALGSGAEEIEISDTIGALSGGTTFHYRVVATNIAGETVGEDETFTTEPPDWEVQPTPNPEAEEGWIVGSRLGDVSCTSQSHCMAMGYSEYASSSDFIWSGFAQQWDGEEWEAVSFPDRRRDGIFDAYSSISCASANWCVAVGHVRGTQSAPSELLIAHWDGMEWAIESAPSGLAEGGSVLNDVSCVSTSSCIAVGYRYVSGEGRYRTLALHWDGREWSVMSTSDPSSYYHNVDLRAISCVSISVCLAVGYYRIDPSTFNDFAIIWDGKTWSNTPTARGFAAWQDVSCAGADLSSFECAVVGLLGGVTNRFDGKTWSSESLPRPIGANGVTVEKVSCSSSTACIAVGSYSAGGGPMPLALRWNGDAWSLLSTTSPAQEDAPEGTGIQGDFFLGVSCVVPNRCTSTGATWLTSGLELTLAERYEGSWPTATTQAPTEIALGSATLNATVNPEGSTTTYQFEYGTTTAYGTKIPIPAEGIGSGTRDVEVDEEIEGLREGMTYHFRVVATNETGTQYGADKSFTTHETPPVFSSAVGSAGSENAQFQYPSGIATDAAGNIWVSDTENHRIQKFDSTGRYLSQFGSEGSGNGQFVAATGLAIDRAGNIYVADESRIQKFDSTGRYLSQFGSEGSGNGQFSYPSGIAIDAAGNILVADLYNHRIQRFDSTGRYLSQFGSEGSGNGQFSYPSGIAMDAVGNIWVADTGGNRIQKFTSRGEYLAQFGSYGSEDGQFITPIDIAFGSGGKIWIIDYDNNRIQKWAYLHDWSLQAASEPSGATGAILTEVSCSSEDFCMAAGLYNDGSSLMPYSQSWDGSRWTVHSMPDPLITTNVAVSGISCASASACTMVGTYYEVVGGDNYERSFALVWDGSRWTIQSTFSAPYGGFSFQDVSCSAANACTAVGNELGDLLVQRWDGTDWSSQTPSLPSGAQWGNFYNVSCSSEGCMASGYYVDDEHDPHPLAMFWNGSAWSNLPMPEADEIWPEGAGELTAGATYPSAVSCVGSQCTLIGEVSGVVDSASTRMSFSAAWDGRAWSVQTLFPPVIGGPLKAPDISCVSMDSCIAVGYLIEGGGIEALAATWDGEEWTSEPPPLPEGASLASLSGVSCSGVGACTAVGYYGKDRTAHPLVGRFE